MNIKNQIAMTEQLLEALKEVEILTKELERLAKELEFVNSSRNIHLNNNIELQKFIRENGIEVPKDLECPF